MSPEQQRIAIGESERWTYESSKNGIPWGWEPDEDPASDPDCIMGTWFHDYLNDLNAMHEVEKTLGSTELQNRYYEEIAEITYGCEETGCRQVVFNQLTATASQRAEAYLKAKGLWES